MRRFALACLFAAALTGGASAQEIRCTFEDAGMGTVRAVLDGQTLALTDGREVRLAAIKVPDAEPAGRLALEKMLGSRAVTLKRLGDDKDRYGRLLAHVFAPDDARSIQQAMLAAGRARVAARVGDTACASELLVAERAARAAKLGLWSDAAYAPRPVDDPAAILAERGRFTLVEGKIVSVRESGGTIYLNFGGRWSEDFTATILKRNERAFAAAGLDLKRLAGRAVRLRGVIEERGGPWIELYRPEQVEMLGDQSLNR
jgi:endonuclease YncB( thermonuclease family)